MDRIGRTVALVVIGTCTRLYPNRFRETFGASIRDDFANGLEELSPRGLPGLLQISGFTCRTVLSILQAAIAERLRSSFRTPKGRRAPHQTMGRGDTMMQGIWQDLRQAARSLRKQPFFSTIVVSTLAVGIGVNAAIFSLVSNVLWRDLPYPEPTELVSVWSSNQTRGISRWGVSLHDYTDWSERSDVFHELGAYNINTINLSGIDQPQRVSYAQVTPGFFRTLATSPILGRFFEEEENLPGRDAVVILSHGFWRELFGGRDDVVGQTVTIDGSQMTIVGVMPPGFTFPTPNVRLWKPFGMVPADEGSRGGRWVRAIARLEPEVSLESARAALDALGRTLASEYPETNDGYGIYVEPLLTTSITGVQAAIFLLWGTTGFLLVIVCANVANMMLARATRRTRETAVRAALGASRLRLVRQFAAEGIPLTLVGGMLGIGVAAVTIRTFPMLLSQQVPRLNEVALDARVLLYSTGVALLVGIVFSIIPAFRSAHHNLAHALHDSRGASYSSASVRARHGIVAMQIALAMSVVVGAGLMIKSLTLLLDTDPGFATDRLLTVRISPSWREMPERSAASQLFQQLEENAESVPGVLGVSAINSLPLTGNSWNTNVTIVGRSEASTESALRGFNRVVLPDYHQTMGIPLLRGRLLDDSDNERSGPVVIINEAAATTWWQGEDPIGAQLRYDGPDARTVVGIVGNVEPGGLGSGAAPMMYVPFRQGRFGHFQNWGMSFVIRTSGDPTALAPVIVDRLTEAATQIPVYALQTMEDLISANVATQRLYTQLLSAFAAIALVLATIGVYSVIAYLVAQRTREIGVRVALGAARSRVLGLVVRRAMILAAIGIGIGTVVATMTSRALGGFLFQTKPVDPLTYLAVGSVLTMAVVVASLEPALRAMRVDPVEALKAD